MTATSGDAIAQRIGLLCENLAVLREWTADNPTAAGRLTALVDAAAAGRADRAWVADLVDLLRRLGIPVADADRGWPFVDHTTGGLPDLGGGSPSLDRYACPHRICDRGEVRRPGGPVPRCAVFAVDLPAVEVPR
jgi:hypothetical protein